MAEQPVLVIITGPPGSGKTTLGKHLGQVLRLPFIHKDGIKESLFDSLGWSDRAWSRKLGIASLDLLFYFVETQLAAGCSHIVESNFYPEFHTPRFLALKDRYGFIPFQIACVTDGEVLYQRFKQRWESGNRHPGHAEHVQLDAIHASLTKGRIEPLDIGGSLYELDTTDFTNIDYEGLVHAIKLAGG